MAQDILNSGTAISSFMSFYKGKSAEKSLADRVNEAVARVQFGLDTSNDDVYTTGKRSGITKQLNKWVAKGGRLEDLLAELTAKEESMKAAAAESEAAGADAPATTGRGGRR